MNLNRLIEFVRSIKAPSEYLARHFHDKEPTTERVCTACVHVAVPTRHMAGRADIELALWAILAGLAVIYIADMIILKFWSPWILRALYKITSMAGKVFAVLSFAYTLIRVSIRTLHCPKCDETQVIPLDSPRARQLLGNKP